MEQQLYRVVFLGRFAEGLGRDEVVANLNDRFRFTDAALARIVPGKIVVLKSGLPRDRAERIARTLSEAGARCRAVSEAPVSEAPAMVCPKCGQEQTDGESCTFCGVVIAKFRSRQETAAETLFPPVSPEREGGDWAMTGIAAALAGTRPWVRLFAILMFLGAGLGLLVVIVTMVTGGFRGAPAALAAVLQVATCALYVVPAYYLYKYAAAIDTYLQGEAPADLELALGYQKSFWKFIGILTAVMMGLALLGIVAAVIIPLVFGG